MEQIRQSYHGVHERFLATPETALMIPHVVAIVFAIFYHLIALYAF